MNRSKDDHARLLASMKRVRHIPSSTTPIPICSASGGRQAWSAVDFAMARARAGGPDYVTMLAFKERHGLTL